MVKMYSIYKQDVHKTSRSGTHYEHYKVHNN